ncbi:CUN029 similar to AcMNPV ORF119 [Culex nigripalpus nucleopolyhedrovirus]|uniref:CUN029 similar to AcMNPV ORF119 n=1 Tax=Culex nigripalpus nucleopolyhedrovirus (isolate Florida/1997) TaxID=645993 RepID=Q919P0_NPVCO|nr:CUN029 similar to AcMNPV ORF119 [Culex nigripalpus nucleopolyhedrovirus]AAK94107.1 CUN029 similar to AcMNPV ORF119 [Culex nigripalpus nucleopolyhedrovirus]
MVLVVLLVMVIFILFILTQILITRNIAHAQRQLVDDPPDRNVQTFPYDPDLTIQLPEKPIELEGNPVQCHKTPTRCTGQGDCLQCRELRARCVEILEDITLVQPDGTEVVLEAGNNYCLATSQEHARSCTPLTGKWILIQMNDMWSAVCSCTSPDMFIKMNLWGDCDVPVGCAPNGVVVIVNVIEMKCNCNVGFVSDVDANGRPYCRPITLRDASIDGQVFKRPPCSDGFIPVSHPALHTDYGRNLFGDICVRDPCSVDPITNQPINARLEYSALPTMPDTVAGRCVGTAVSQTYGIFGGGGSMIKLPPEDVPVKLADHAISIARPRSLGNNMLYFWGRRNTVMEADMDLLQTTIFREVNERYLNIANWSTVDNVVVFRFRVTEGHEQRHRNLFTELLKHMNELDQPRCMQHQRPGCTLDVCVWNDPRPGLVNMHNFFTGQRCYLSRTSQRFVGMSAGLLCAFGLPSYYRDGEAPAVFVLDDVYRNGGSFPGIRVQHQTSAFVSNQTGAVNSYLGSFPFYSRT